MGVSLSKGSAQCGAATSQTGVFGHMCGLFVCAGDPGVPQGDAHPRGSDRQLAAGITRQCQQYPRPVIDTAAAWVNHWPEYDRGYEFRMLQREARPAALSSLLSKPRIQVKKVVSPSRLNPP